MTSPIFVHPIKWSKLHLVILRVRDLNQDYPVEQVLRRDYFLDSSNSIEDKAVADILKQISVGDLPFTMYMGKLREVEERDLPISYMESSLLGVSGIWLRKIYEAKGY